MKDKLPEIKEKKHWITEEEVNDVYTKVTETWEWLEVKVTEQMSFNLFEDPLFRIEDVLKKVKKVDDLFKKVTNKK